MDLRLYLDDGWGPRSGGPRGPRRPSRGQQSGRPGWRHAGSPSPPSRPPRRPGQASAWASRVTSLAREVATPSTMACKLYGSILAIDREVRTPSADADVASAGGTHSRTGDRSGRPYLNGSSKSQFGEPRIKVKRPRSSLWQVVEGFPPHAYIANHRGSGGGAAAPSSKSPVVVFFSSSPSSRVPDADVRRGCRDRLVHGQPRDPRLSPRIDCSSPRDSVINLLSVEAGP